MPEKAPLAILGLLFIMASAANADALPHGHPVDYRSPGGEFKEKNRSGPCEIEREQKRDGEYKEERKCEDGPRGYEQKEKFRKGPCKIEREWKRDGKYEEKVECKP